ncbi:MAG: 50S ribosomal protein L6, partial [Nitrososphaerota archaeon]|nr:50S ribosomal protein L6 [Nitrososphaerota archaeon]
MSTETVQGTTIAIPEGVSVRLEGRTLSIKGKLGEAKKHFDKVNINLAVQGNKVTLSPFSAKKKDNVIINTVASIVNNMVTGVTKGFTYRLKVVYAHFPITVKVKGDQVLVENFVGERSPRVSQIVGSCKVSVEGDDVPPARYDDRAPVPGRPARVRAVGRGAGGGGGVDGRSSGLVYRASTRCRKHVGVRLEPLRRHAAPGVVRVSQDRDGSADSRPHALDARR